jgi:hypothetical protein
LTVVGELFGAVVGTEAGEGVGRVGAVVGVGSGDGLAVGSERGEGVGRGAVVGVGCGDAVGVGSILGSGMATACICVGTGVTSRTMVARGIGVDVTNRPPDS